MTPGYSAQRSQRLEAFGGAPDIQAIIPKNHASPNALRNSTSAQSCSHVNAVPTGCVPRRATRRARRYHPAAECAQAAPHPRFRGRRA
jgi:hypothetical protein